MFLSLANAMALCIDCGIKQLYFCLHDPSQRRQLLFSPNEPWITEKTLREVDLDDDEALLCLDRNALYFVTDYLFSPAYSAAIDSIKSFFTCLPKSVFPLGTLVAHIRGGDVFKPRNRPSSYLQPPLSWYTSCVERHARRHKDISVVIVHEDRRNPCATALMDWCGRTGIPVAMQSGSLESDYKVLLMAQALIDSRGTFTYPARMISDNLKMVYEFDVKCLERDALERLRPWTASPEQVDLLLNLPPEKMSIPEDFYDAAFSVPAASHGGGGSAHSVEGGHENERPSPPKSIPEKYVRDFTMEGKIPVHHKYYDESAAGPVHNTHNAYDGAFEKFAEKTFEYYGKSLDWFYEASGKYPLRDKKVLIFGLAGCNLEAFAAWSGAREVVVVDYNSPICEHPKIAVMSHEELLHNRLKFDVALSFSSFEHDGLGRYGDPIKPYGDFDAMSFARNCLTPDGFLYFAVPIGKDCLVWNAHRIYGRIRLPLLLRGWKCVDIYGGPRNSKEARRLFSRRAGRFRQPLVILQPNYDSSIFEDRTKEKLLGSGLEKPLAVKLRNALVNGIACLVPGRSRRRRLRRRHKI